MTTTQTTRTATPTNRWYCLNRATGTMYVVRLEDVRSAARRSGIWGWGRYVATGRLHVEGLGTFIRRDLLSDEERPLAVLADRR